MILTPEDYKQIYRICEEECEKVNKMSWEEQITELLSIIIHERGLCRCQN